MTQVILAGPDEGALTRAAYPAFAAAGFDVAAVADSPQKIADFAAALRDCLIVVEVDVYPGAAEAAAALASLPVRAAVVLPDHWKGEQAAFAGLPNLVAGFTAPVSWPQVAAEIKGRLLAPATEAAPAPAATPAPGGPTPDATPPAAAARLHANTGPGRVVAFWSGPAGGTGRTTLALALAMLASERKTPALLLALSEPAVSAYLRLPRNPNVLAFFESGNLTGALQKVTWEGGALSVLLGPARPQDGVADREPVGRLIEAAREAGGLAVLDLPTLTPGGSVWALEPLTRASDVVLVANPTSAGVAATVEALVTLRAVSPARLHLVLNHRARGGLSAAAFTESVINLWGSCPPLGAEIPFLSDLGKAMEGGETPLAVEQLALAVETLGVALGLIAPREEPAPDKRRAAEPSSAATAAEKPGGAATAGEKRPRRKLISLEVTD
jgi:MinD-like ATPase involved in chromosome partitioning or flagellar assembly